MRGKLLANPGAQIDSEDLSYSSETARAAVSWSDETEADAAQFLAVMSCIESLPLPAGTKLASYEIPGITCYRYRDIHTCCVCGQGTLILVSASPFQ